jgi:NAD(P)-dependent dehydrogenase (short-subunit alcohol dehydrogenase family)
MEAGVCAVVVGLEYGLASLLGSGSYWTRDQACHAHEVVGRCHEVTGRMDGAVEHLTAGDVQREEAHSARTPLGRLAQPEEIASSAVWLCSVSASYITGHALAIDGGYVAQ